MTEPKVVRYSVTLSPVFMAESEMGGWVSYSDYEALQAENKRLREALAEIIDWDVLIVKRFSDKIQKTAEAALEEKP